MQGVTSRQGRGGKQCRTRRRSKRPGDPQYLRDGSDQKGKPVEPTERRRHPLRAAL